MKAAVCRAFREPLVIENVTLADPGPQEIQVRIRACAICHSDIAFMDGAWGGALPAVYGHEASGEVTAVGSGVTRFKPGDPVVVTLIRSCGHCHYCARGATVACDTAETLAEATPLHDASGAPLTQAMYCGAFAESVTVHQSQASIMPGDMPYPEASLLACGVLTGFGAVTNTAGVRAGQSAVVIGCGGVGLNALQAARVVGAHPIVAIDIVEDKLDLARQFGATHTIDARSVDLAETVRGLTEGRGADFVFVSVGVRAAFMQAHTILAKCGAVVLVGMPETGALADYDPGTMASYGQRIYGSKMGSARVDVDIPYLIGLYRNGALKLTELISGTYPLDEINEAIASSRSGTAIRNVIVFD